MRALTRKAWRDLLHLRSQAFAIALILAAGTAMTVMSATALDSLRAAQDAWLERSHFADAFASVVRAPSAAAERLQALPGVVSVQTRVVKDVTLDVPGLREPAIGRMISIPETPRPGLCEIHLRRGRWIEPGVADEVLVNEAFAQAHDLGPGATLVAVVNGRRRHLSVVGVALSPEYVYAFRPGDALPDDRRFGILWTSRRDLAAVFGMEGAWNDAVLDLAPEASLPEVLRRIDLVTAAYGGRGAYGREDQPSFRMISDELDQLRVMATVPPAIFLGVAAFLLHVVLGRLVATQRVEIAALRAFGYRVGEVAGHYLLLVGIVALGGAALGVAVGVWLGGGLTRNYARFFRFPDFTLVVAPGVVALAVGVTVGAALLGAWGAVRRAARLPPAEAMRPEPPARYRPSWAERLGLGRLLSPAGRMILRQMERRPLRTALSALAIAFGAAVVVLGGFVGDTLDHVVDLRFRVMDASDVRVNLVEVSSPDALEAIRRLPGVRHAEPVRDVAARFRHGSRSRRAALQGLLPEGRLFRLVDDALRPVALPPGGLVLSERLAASLDARPGDVVTLEVLEGAPRVVRAPVASVVADVSGATAYAALDTVRALMREGDTVTGAWLDVDEARLDALYRAIKEAPRIAGAGVKEASLESFEATVAENLLRMRVATFAFAVVLACGVVYNAARISLAERARELATLRVMGFTRAEISMILLGELAVLTLAAVPAGLWIGRWFAEATMAALTTDEYRFPTVIGAATYATAAAVTFAAAILSGLVVRRRLDRLDLVGVLKAQE